MLHLYFVHLDVLSTQFPEVTKVKTYFNQINSKDCKEF